MSHARDVIEELRAPTRSLRQAAPEAWAGFGQLHDAALADGVLPARVKEGMALVIAVVKQGGGGTGGDPAGGSRGPVRGVAHGRRNGHRLRPPGLGCLPGLCSSPWGRRLNSPLTQLPLGFWQNTAGRFTPRGSSET